MDDLISRKHFDERVRLAGGMADEELTQDFKDGVLTVLEILKTEPSIRVQPAQKEGKWIPVSERLPEESLNSVIGWDAHRERCVFVQYIDGYFQIMGSDDSFDIVAWMPLPEPYKEEGE